MIRWLLLDGSGVLFTMDHGARLRAIAARSDPSMTPEHIDRTIWRSGLDGLFDAGYFSETEILDELKRRLGYRGSVADLREDWCTGFTLVDELMDLVDELAPAVRLAVLSDNGPLLLASIPARFPRLLRAAEHIVFSCETGVCKPARLAFETAVATLKVTNRADVLFVDDLDSNCVAARRLGLRAHRFSSTERLRQALRLLSSAPEDAAVAPEGVADVPQRADVGESA